MISHRDINATKESTKKIITRNRFPAFFILSPGGEKEI